MPSTMPLIDAIRLAYGHYQAGRLTEAADLARLILASVPEQTETAQLLGVVEYARGRPVEGMRALRRAIATRPDYSDALTNLGVLLQNTGRLTEALRLQDWACRLAPQMPATHVNRGCTLQSLGRYGDAMSAFQTAVALKPDDAQAVNNLGAVLREQARVKAALAAHRRAIALAPGFVDAYRDLGHALRELGGLVEARDACARGALLDPGRTELISYQLFLKQAVCDWSGYDALVRRVGAIIDGDQGIVLPLATLSIDTSTPQQYRAACLFRDRVIRPMTNPADSVRRPLVRRDGRLTVAYFSADFHEHATAYLAAEMFELHDRARFRTIAYSYGQDDGSPMRRRLTAAFERFHDIRGVGFDRVVHMIEEDGVDILVDLKGYTKQSRLELLSRRLAPIEVSYLGYPGTIACEAMDYIIGDRFVTPPEHQPHYSERLVRMPDSYQINDRHRPIAEPGPSRAECGLPEDAFVFCSFNTTYKLTPAIFGVWMSLLRQVPGSVLWLFEANGVVEANLRREALAWGIVPERLIFAPKRPLADHLARYRIADLFVDTLPYTGHTTTSDALWAGLPVVTCQGDTFASRVATSLLNAAGVPELVTTSLDAYEALALELARNPVRLADIRRRLNETRLTVPLFDSRRFTRHLERAYTIMAEIQDAGEAPREFDVPPLPPGTPD
ncbi:O-linked N-acetylglucosamine transferase, SPINDLY family protein [Azospirillum doebereinerae]